jgi:hypothetical protein
VGSPSVSSLVEMPHHARVFGGALVVRDHDDGLAQLAVQAVEQVENIGSGDAIQIGQFRRQRSATDR